MEAAAALLGGLGGLAEVEERGDGQCSIRGFSCPLSLAAAGHPEVCLAAETLISDLVGAPVQERCERSAASLPRCCFRVGAEAKRPERR
jgi:predicted ArsR family transcriptional regulator